MNFESNEILTRLHEFSDKSPVILCIYARVRGKADICEWDVGIVRIKNNVG